MKLYIKTFGCQMNVHDTDRIKEIMGKAGYESTDDPSKADVALINSCTVREKAWHKAISEAGRLRSRRRRAHNANHAVIGVVGCVAQQEGDHIFELLPGVDLVVAPDHYHLLPELLFDLKKDGIPRAVIGFDKGEPEDFLNIQSIAEANPVSAFVTIMKGCRERCAYCIVPTVRGPERFRPSSDIVREVEMLVSKGVREVTLLGQKVNAYNHAEASFVELIRRVDSISGLERLRFTSPHPRHMTAELTESYGLIDTLCESIHLPLQAGSDLTLKRMGRRYTAAEYLDVVRRLRAAVSDIAISTDLIVGYPGETEEDFEQTLRMIDEVQFCGAFSFKYSPRPGTRAAAVDDDVTPQEKASRLARVHKKIEMLERGFRKTQVGKVLQVLVEGEGRMPGQLSGRARNGQIVNFTMTGELPLREKRGCLMDVEITRANPHSLEGRAQ